MKTKLISFVLMFFSFISSAKAVWYTSDTETPAAQDHLIYNRIQYPLILIALIALGLLFKEVKTVPQKSGRGYALFAVTAVALASLLLLKLLYLEA